MSNKKNIYSIEEMEEILEKLHYKIMNEIKDIAFYNEESEEKTIKEINKIFIGVFKNEK